MSKTSPCIPYSLLHLLPIFLLAFFTIVAIHSHLFYEKSEENNSADRLHPPDTDELRQCLSPDLNEEVCFFLLKLINL